MKVCREFPYSVRVLENVWIPMEDGTKLAARIWMPEGAESDPVPAILEYLPYRKRDGTRSRDAMQMAYFAGHGYVCIRVDIRGSGDSEGVLQDEYLPREQEDGLAILSWIADQPWCSGTVGMIGLSWGGFNGLQIAALDSPQLGAVISVCSTDDRYADDVHYMGGCLLGDNLSWASIMFSYNSCPPDPAIAGENWRDMWFDRLQHSGLWLEKWLRHQRRDSYWKHGSICEDFSAVTCPVMVCSGWADGYTNAVFRMLEGLDVPRQGLIGPWSHRYPELGEPGPAVGFLQEALRWWDHWLKGKETGIMGEPMLRAWIQDYVPPSTSYKTRPGRWVGEESWPSANVHDEIMYLEPGKILAPGEKPESSDPLSVHSPLSLGLFAGKWCSYASGPDMPHDQREEDGGSLVFESDPLEKPFEILGSPVLSLLIASNQPTAMVAVRLSDVAPDGKATRITYGILNLTHRESHEHPAALEKDTFYPVEVRLNDTGYAFPINHRIRISISSSYWPIAWPAPAPVMLTIQPDRCALVLPVRRSRPQDGSITFAQPEAAPPVRTTIQRAPEHHWRVIRDLNTDLATLEVLNDKGAQYIPEIDLEVEKTDREWYSSRGDDFGSIRGETRHVRRFKRGDWNVRTETQTIITSTAKHFHIHARLDAFEGDERVYSKNWSKAIERDHV
ncbi:MAG: CocE/NonD family hydrolase [Desulfovibrionales bacterium]